jgi:hypothetical protein
VTELGAAGGRGLAIDHLINIEGSFTSNGAPRLGTLRRSQAGAAMSVSVVVGPVTSPMSLLQGDEDEHADPAPVTAEPQETRTRWLNGYTVFAVAIMFVLGLWQFLAGLTAVVRDGLYATPPGYTYSFNIAGWGGLVLLLGILIAGTAVVVLQGRSWGDTAAIVLASLSMVANFLLIPFYPIWSLVIIALNTTLIWALTTRDRNVPQPPD